MTESDTVILDLHFSELSDVEFAIEAFKNKAPYEDAKTLILISSVLTWEATPRIVKPEEIPEGEEGEEGIPEEDANKEEDPESKQPSVKDEEDEVEGEEKEGEEGAEGAEGQEGQEGVEGQEANPQEQKPEEVEEEEEPVEYLPFKESDYLTRAAKEKYEKWKKLEDDFLNLNIENVKTFVICAGVLYGKGEVAFKNALKVTRENNELLM